MASAAQIDAGKQSASLNSTKHGLAGGVLFIEGEDPNLFHILVHELVAEHRPVGMTEEVLVFKLAEQLWFGTRANRLLTQALDRNAREDNSKQVALMLRYKTSTDRGFSQALTQLLKLKKERPNRPIGFVSQRVQAAAAPPPAPAPTPNGFVSQNPPNAPRTRVKIGRNEPCPCRSGLKFKRCCLNKPQSAARLELIRN
jgi:hypothetical protein